MDRRTARPAAHAPALVGLAALPLLLTTSNVGVTRASATQTEEQAAPAPSQVGSPAFGELPVRGPVAAGPARLQEVGRPTLGAARPGEIPWPALQAYQRSEEILGEVEPGCGLTWTLLAAVGQVETAHGTASGGELADEGTARPAIHGAALDGEDGRPAVEDTDGGELDGEDRWDLALGPMQLMPGVWSLVGVDGDGDGERNPQDIDDAALAAGVYLCASSGDLAAPVGVARALTTYNAAEEYAEQVLAVEKAYRTGDFAVADRPEPQSIGEALDTGAGSPAARDSERALREVREGSAPSVLGARRHAHGAGAADHQGRSEQKADGPAEDRVSGGGGTTKGGSTSGGTTADGRGDTAAGDEANGTDGATNDSPSDEPAAEDRCDTTTDEATTPDEESPDAPASEPTSSADQSTDESTDESTEQTADQTAEQTAGEAGSTPADPTADATTDTTTDPTHDPNADPTDDPTDDATADDSDGTATDGAAPEDCPADDSAGPEPTAGDGTDDAGDDAGGTATDGTDDGADDAHGTTADGTVQATDAATTADEQTEEDAARDDQDDDAARDGQQQDAGAPADTQGEPREKPTGGKATGVETTGEEQPSVEVTGVLTACGEGYCLDGAVLDLSAVTDLSAPAAGDLDGNGTVDPLEAELEGLQGETVEMVVVEGSDPLFVLAVDGVVLRQG